MYDFMFKYQMHAWVLVALLTGLLIGLFLGGLLTEHMPQFKPLLDSVFA